MTNLISVGSKVTGKIYLGTHIPRSPTHQPTQYFSLGSQYAIAINNNYSALNYNNDPELPIASDLQSLINQPGRVITTEIVEYTFVSIWVAFDAYQYDSTAPNADRFIGQLEFQKVSSAGTYIPRTPLIRRTNGVNPGLYQLSTIARYPSKILYYASETIEFSGSVIKPNYINLITGYYLDSRIIPSYPVIVASKTIDATLKYYQWNKNESIPGLTTIEWMKYEISLVKGRKYILPIYNLVLGTLLVSDQTISSLIANASPSAPSAYIPFSFSFKNNLPILFSEWNILADAKIEEYKINISNLAPAGTITQVSTTQIIETNRIVRRLSANNNYWNNQQIQTDDLNYYYTHPMFAIDNQRAYDWHIQPQRDGSIGNLVMDSPRTIEIHAALNAGKWGFNPDDINQPRKDDLGWRIQRTNEVLGIRVGTDLKFDPVKEKSMVRLVIPSEQKLDPEKVGINNFASDGMVVKRINNRFKGKDEVVSDQCVIVQDVLQLIQEYHEQHNLAVGIQESSAIEIKEGKNRARFDNQLGLLVEMFNLLTSANEMTRASLISSLVSQSQTNEIIA